MSAMFKSQMIELLPRLRRFALGLCCDRERADDLVQAACERALKHERQWQPGTRLDSWMFRIVQNLWFDELRATRQRAHEPLSGIEDMEEELQWEDGVHAQMDLAEVMRALAALPESMRAVLMLVCVEGLSYQDAAQTLEVPIGTVMSRLSRARLALHRRLNAADTGVNGGDHARVH